MKRQISEIATRNLMMLPSDVWEGMKGEMERTYPDGWLGLHKQQAVSRVRKCHAQLGLGDVMLTVTDTSEYRVMTDSKRPFLQMSVFPHPDDPEEYMHMMVFGNPTLLPLSKVPSLDMYVDAMFDVHQPLSTKRSYLWYICTKHPHTFQS